MLKYSVHIEKFAIFVLIHKLIQPISYFTMQYAVLDIKTIEEKIVPFLPTAKRGYTTQATIPEIVNAILYKLKTGCQWDQLPVYHLFSTKVLKHGAVFHHYRKWCKGGHWKEVFINLIADNKEHIDLSISHTDGSHTPCTRGGELAAFQDRKKRMTTNSIYFTDNQGLPLAMSLPKKGNHNDLHEIEKSMSEIFNVLDSATINTDGLFNNADGGFDSASYRKVCEGRGMITNIAENPKYNHEDVTTCFDAEMYKHRFKIERTNAWMDSYRNVLMCHDKTASSWIGWNYLAFMVIFLKKIHKSQKFK